MFRILLVKEILNHLLTLRLGVVVGLTVVLCSWTTVVGSLDFSERMQAYPEAGDGRKHAAGYRLFPAGNEYRQPTDDPLHIQPRFTSCQRLHRCWFHPDPSGPLARAGWQSSKASGNVAPSVWCCLTVCPDPPSCWPRVWQVRSASMPPLPWKRHAPGLRASRL